MTRDDKIKGLIDHLIAVDRMRRKPLNAADAVRYNAEFDATYDKLFSALAGSERPEGPGTYLLTVEAEVNPGGMFSINNGPWDDWWSVEHITGTWRKVEP